MHHLSFRMILCFVFIMGSKSWFWGRRRRPNPTTTTSRSVPSTTLNQPQSSPFEELSFTATTPFNNNCEEPLTCTKFSEIVDEMQAASFCKPYLNSNCVEQNSLMQFEDFTAENAEILPMILSQVNDRNCDCKNRSVETFCHFLLPECRTGTQQANACEVICDESSVTLPCSDYCLTLTAKYVQPRLVYFYVRCCILVKNVMCCCGFAVS